MPSRYMNKVLDSQTSKYERERGRERERVLARNMRYDVLDHVLAVTPVTRKQGWGGGLDKLYCSKYGKCHLVG